MRTPSAPFDMASLQDVLPRVFKSSQPTPVVPEPTFPVASGGYGAQDLYAKIQDYAMTFTPIGSTIPTTIPFQPKAIQELWDTYGRMNATLGVELPFTNQFNQTTIPMGYAEPTTETITDGQPQIWKITHNGVDTHPVHFHLVNVQVINRVGWDGAIRPPDPNEMGWKETVRMNPLEDVIVALLPKSQTLPFLLPDSVRPIDPTLPTTAMLNATDFGNLGVDPQATPVNGKAVTIPNAVTDYGHEFVWHCHILGHEENDFMRPLVFKTSTSLPPAPASLQAYTLGQTVPGKTNYVTPYANPFANQIVLQWNDTAPVSAPSNFRVERSRDNGATWTTLTTISFLPGYPPIFNDKSLAPNASYIYRVIAHNAIGDSSPAVSAPVAGGSWGAATGLTITPSKPTPHVMGTNVVFNAAGSGAPANVAYQYRFWLDSGAGNVLVQDYGAGTWWTLPADTPIGNYTITVDVRTSTAPTNAAGGYDFRATLPYRIVNAPIPPVTVATPVPGVYWQTPITVDLASSTLSPPATIYYTTDGTVPTTASAIYAGPIVLNATTTINYFAVDVNGVAEAVHSDTWSVHSPDLVASATINSGAASTKSLAVTVNLNAFDPVGIAGMQFSNDPNPDPNLKVWSAEEPYASGKIWNLAPGSDGTRTVYVRFRDRALPPPGYLYPAPISASIVLDTVPPVTAASPINGTYVSGPIQVTLTSNEPGTIYYTTDGTTPTYPQSGSTQIYSLPVPVTNIPGQSTTIKYFAVDGAGNVESVKSGTWTINANSFTAGVKIKGGASITNTTDVTLDLSASDPTGIATVMFSNDGISYTGEIPVAAISSGTVTITATSVSIAGYPYTLASGGDGARTVYVKFRNKAQPTGALSDPVSAGIILDTTPPVTTAGPIPAAYSFGPIPVSLTANEPATIHYTLDGSAPNTSSPVYLAPISVVDTTTIRYFAVDAAGNVEAPKAGSWQIHAQDLVASVSINTGAAVTNSRDVTLTLNAFDPTGVDTMQFSNVGGANPVDWTLEEPYRTTKTWTLVPGDGVKTVYVRFRDKTLPTGYHYDPVTANITLDTTPPVTSAGPITGTYSTSPVAVTLTTNEPAVIYYTLDGTTPSTASSVYLGPTTVVGTTTIKYFAVDAAGNAEPVRSGIWAIHSSDLVASVRINNGAGVTNSATVTLSLAAFDPAGISKMQFSNDGVVYSAEEDYTTSKVWTLAPGDGVKVVYVRFRDKTLPSGNLYEPITATIDLDMVAPQTMVSPVPGTYSMVPVTVTLTTNERGTIYYTTDGSIPTIGSPVYRGPITLVSTTTIKLFAVDAAGNAEAVKTGTWTMHVSDLAASVKINNGSTWTDNPAVNLTLSANDPTGIASMQFSEDGLNYSAEEPYSTGKAWTFPIGEEVKTIYVRFRDRSLPSGHLYDPVAASITLGSKDGLLPGTNSYLASALKVLQIANGLAAPSPLDIVHGDVAPYSNGAAQPDGKMNLLDVYTIMLRMVGLIATF